MSTTRVHRERGAGKPTPSREPGVEEKKRAARVLLTMVGRQERRRRGEPELQVVDGGRDDDPGRAAA